MLTVPKSKVVRGFSFFGVSFVYVIFEDGTDIYWARSRVLEFLNAATSRLPAGVTPTIGPDATGVGWVYQYAVMSKELNLADTRTIQDWNLKFALAKAEGVAEVASVGGFVKQYNVILDPQRMRDLGITDAEDARRHPREQRRRRWPHRRAVGVRVRDPRQGLSEEHRRSRQHRAEERRRHAGLAARRGARRARSRRTARHHRTRTAKEKSPAASCCSASA